MALLFALPVLAQQRAAMFHNPPARVKASDSLRIDGLLVNGKDLKTIYVRFRKQGGEYRELAMTLRYGDLYRAELPSWELEPPVIEYFIEGQPRRGARVSLFMSASAPARVPVPREVKTPRTGEGDRRAEEERREADRRAEADRRETEQRESEGRAEAARREEERKEAERRESARRESDRRESDRREAERKQAERRDADRRNAADRRADSENRSPVPPPQDPGDDTSWAQEPEQPSPKKRSELAEELALYAAEDTSASLGRHGTEVRETPITSTALGRSEIRALGARSLPDVLHALAGLFVSRDTSGFHRIGVRGIRADAEVLVFLDGHRLNHFYDGRALIDLPVENVARIEVVRGPSAVREASGALLAVVNIFTDREEGLRVAASAGNLGAFTGHLAGGTSLGEVRVSGTLDLVRHGGAVRPVAEDSLGAEMIDQGYLRDTAQPVGTTRDDRWFLGAGVTASVGQLSAQLRFLGEQRNALIGLFDTLGAQSPLGWRAVLGDVRYQRDLSPTIQLRASVRADEQSTSRRYQQSPGAGTYWDEDFTGDRILGGYCTVQISFGDPCPEGHLFADGILEQQRASAFGVGTSVETDLSLIPTNRLTVGLSADYRSVYERSTSVNYQPADLRLTPGGSLTPWTSSVLQDPGLALSRFEGAFYAQDVWTIIAPLTVTVGFRADLVQVPQVEDPEARPLRFSGRRFIPSLNPRLAVAYAPIPSLVLTTRYGRAFRAPTPSELLPTTPDSEFNGGRFTGNPLLEPSTVDTVDLGADLVQSAGEARVRLRANVFFSYLNNAIAPTDISGNVIPISNRLGVRVLGAEAEARLEVTERARAWVNASWFRAEDLEAREPVRLLTDTPQWQVNANISMPVGDWLNVDLLLQSGAERRNLGRTPLENIRRWRLPAYSLIGVQLRTERVFEHWEASLSVHNAFAFDLADDSFRMDRMPGGVPREGVAGQLTLRGSY
ncbi:MAG: TonB-dependent receptor [Myxococcota bacterium]|nr:TonB-dependent receptor [Myxococcota bacterium]